MFKLSLIPLLAVAVISFGLSSDLMAQEDMSTRMLRPGPSSDSPFAGTSGKMSSLLSRPHIQEDLELTKEQVKQIVDLRREHDQATRDMMKGFREQSRDMKPEERRKYYREMAQKRKDSMAEFDEKIKDVLLPFQANRIDQIQIQFKLSNMSKHAVSPILHPAVKEKLGIDNDQEKAILKRMEEIGEELEKKIAKLRQQAAEDVMKELTSEQRKTYEELVGEKLRAPKRVRRSFQDIEDGREEGDGEDG